MAEQKTQSKAKQILLTILGAIMFIAFISMLVTGNFPWRTKPSASTQLHLNKDLMQLVSEYNKQAPFMIDANTQFDNIMLLPGNKIRYTFTAVNMTKDEIDVDAAKDEQATMLINQIRTNPQMKIFRKNKVSFSLLYKDKDGDFIYELAITPDMYED